MNRRSLLWLTTFAILSPFGANAAIMPMLTSTGDGHLRDGYTGVETFAGVVGEVFTLNANTTVTALGIYDGPNSASGTDGDGLRAGHDIVLWEGSTQLAFLHINASTGTLVGAFRYLNLGSSVPLVSGHTYTLVASYTSATTDDVFRDRNNGGSGFTAPTFSNPPFSMIGFAFGSSASSAPSTAQFGAGDSGYIGPNLLFNDGTGQGAAPTPEPASLAIWGLGALGCAVAGYRRRKLA